MKRLASCLLVFALTLSMIPGAFAAGDLENAQQIQTQIDRAAADGTGYKVTFQTEHAAIDVYNTQDYTAPSTTNAAEAYARDSKTGEIDTSGDGQVNFKVNAEEGYVVDTVTADRNYKNLKDSADTGVEGIYRLTKVTGPVAVTVTTRRLIPGNRRSRFTRRSSPVIPVWPDIITRTAI